MRKAFFLALAFGALMLASGARAQDESVDVAVRGTPPLWRLTRPANPDSEVWVLGTVGAMPRGMDWNKEAIGDLIGGARAVITGPQANFDIIDAGWFLLWHGGELSLPRGKTLEGVLPDAARAHFVKIRTDLGKDANRYATDIPVRAIFRLQGDFQDKYKMGSGNIQGTIRSLASSKRVPIAPAGKFEVMDLARQMVKLPLEKQSVCFGTALDDMDRVARDGEIAARAWARGDFKTVKAHYAEYGVIDCIVAEMQSAANISEFQVATFVSAINGALNQKGKTVVLIGIGPFLRDNGVLARLAKQGVTVEAPPE